MPLYYYSIKKDIAKVRMSRDLIGLAILAILCIVISPFYKKQEYTKPTVKPLNIKDIDIHIKSKTENPKNIVVLIGSFLPITVAGSEMSSYETIKYLRSRGHSIIIFVDKYKVNEYDGFKIYKYDQNDPFCISELEKCDIILFSLSEDPKNFELVSKVNKPTFLFIHIITEYHWILAHKVTFPLYIIYNSHMTQDNILTIHDNMRMIPYVNINQFKPLSSLTIHNNVVCLINCNPNKGADMFNTLAKRMSDVQFLGVKGGYSEQITDNSIANLTYMETQSDIRVVFKQIGILLMPSKNETWGRTAVEAMASGVPVIHSESAGLVECMGGAGICCNRYDKDEWEAAIRRILGDPAYREHLRQNGFRRVKEIEIEQNRGRQELAVKIEKDT